MQKAINPVMIIVIAANFIFFTHSASAYAYNL